MRKDAIKPGFYWIKRYNELTIGKVVKTDGSLCVLFPGSSAVYEIGRSNATQERIRPNQFIDEVLSYPWKEQVLSQETS